MRPLLSRSRFSAALLVLSLSAIPLLVPSSQAWGQGPRIYVGGNPGYYRTSSYTSHYGLTRGAGFSYVAGFASPVGPAFAGSPYGLGANYGGYYGYEYGPGFRPLRVGGAPAAVYGNLYPGSRFGYPLYGDPVGYPPGAGYLRSFGGYGYPGFGAGIGGAAPGFGYGYRGFYPW